MFDREIEILLKEWYRTEPLTYLKGKTFTAKEQSKEFQSLRVLIRDISEIVQNRSGQSAFDQAVKKYISNSHAVDKSMIEKLYTPDMLQATVDFFDRSRAYDTSLSIEDIGQAMRNVWIINMIQKLENREACLTDSAFAYSMLYPLTDNLLDATKIDSAYKLKVMNRFGKRLSGERLTEESAYESKLFDMVELVEGEFDRKMYPSVYWGMMSIHKAQLNSQKQHQKGLSPYEAPLLEYTFHKGGTSVLADAFFVKPELSEAERVFYCHYGVVLQLCDDLQDLAIDYANNHQTIFSVSYERILDRLILKTLAFTETLIEKIEDKSWHEIYRSCLTMMVASACMMAPNQMSRSFYKYIIQFAPLKPKQLLKLRKEAKNLESLAKKQDNIKRLRSYILELNLDS